MNMKRWVSILIGVTLIAFGIGIFSLIYNDNFRTSNILKNGIIRVKSNGDNVTIGKNGIVVKDGNSNVNIGWDGIDVRDGDEHVTIGWGGITVKEGGETKYNLGSPNRWGIFNSNKLTYATVDEDEFVDTKGIDSIIIFSKFVDVKIFEEDREDIHVKYYGGMKSDVVPELDINKRDSEVVIKLNSPESYSVTESDVVLEIFLPIKYKKSIATTTSSADIHVENLLLDYLTLYTSSGDIKIIETEAESFNLFTSSGDIESNSSKGSFDMVTSSGDIFLSLQESKGDINIATSSGDVEINYWVAVDYNVTGTSSSGDFYFNGSNILEKDNRGRVELFLGKGGNTMNITTSSGDIYLKNN